MKKKNKKKLEKREAKDALFFFLLKTNLIKIVRLKSPEK